jgi:S-adenosylmethionine-diacylglycerol 3-amino-3-carboxypropyl transferase
LLRTALAIKPSDIVTSVASAGDNTLYLLTDSPKLMIAADLNPVQLHLLSLKIVAFQNLSHGELIGFLGYRSHSNRTDTYKKLREHLSSDAQTHWDTQTKAIDEGIIFNGKFEKYLRLFGKYIRPLIHSNKTVHDLLKTKSKTEQQDFFRDKWQNWRWNLMIKIFFSKKVMSRLGRSKGMMEEVSDSGTAILERGNVFFSSLASQQSYFIEFIFNVKPLPLPPYLLPENYQIIKDNLHKIVLHLGTIESIPDSYGKINTWNLSNIFEYMKMEDFAACSNRIMYRSTSDARLAYWNLFKERDMKTIMPNLLAVPIDRSNDAGFFYRNFFVYQNNS